MAEERNDGGRRPNHQTAKHSEVVDVAWKSREMLNKAASARLGGMRACHGASEFGRTICNHKMREYMM